MSLRKIPFSTQSYAPFINGYCFYTIDNTDNTLVYLPEDDFTKMYHTMPGQIQRDSEFGKELYKLAATAETTKWLEIGTWNGLGSTKCILDGFAERTVAGKPELASVEIDPILFNAAEHNLSTHPARSCVSFCRGKLMPYSNIQAQPFPTPDTLGEAEQKSPHFFMHYDRERTLYETAEPFLPPFFPEVAVLDGGEYSGYLDWLHLQKSDLKYLCLDDTNVTKNKKVIAELGSDWACIAHGNDRNGWAIYQKQGSVE